MTPNWRFLPLETCDAVINMATDEALFQAKVEDPTLPNTLRLYRWQPSAVSIGKHQELEVEVDVRKAEELGVDVVRRISGGGAVFHDNNGEITYGIIANKADFVQTANEFYTVALAGISHACSHLGIQAEYGQIHCPGLFVGGKKISGNSQAQSKGVILQHGTVLVRYNPELMYSVLRARPDKPRLKMIQSVYAHVTTLERILERQLKFAEVAEALEKGFQSTFGVMEWSSGGLTEQEQMLVTKYSERYLSSEWTINKAAPNW